MSAIEAKFMQKVALIPFHSCWEWTGTRFNSGYGRFFDRHFKTQLAHRIAYQIFKGEVLDNLIVMHSCDNKTCVNPQHLFSGTNKDNTQDMISKGRKYPQLGSTNPQSSLDETQVLKIRAEYNAGAVQQQLAVKFGVTPANVNLIIKRKIWSHI